jgi:hypothetical protein
LNRFLGGVEAEAWDPSSLVALGCFVDEYVKAATAEAAQSRIATLRLIPQTPGGEGRATTAPPRTSLAKRAEQLQYQVDALTRRGRKGRRGSKLAKLQQELAQLQSQLPRFDTTASSSGAP